MQILKAANSSIISHSICKVLSFSYLYSMIFSLFRIVSLIAIASDSTFLKDPKIILYNSYNSSFFTVTDIKIFFFSVSANVYVNITIPIVKSPVTFLSLHLPANNKKIGIFSILPCMILV